MATCKRMKLDHLLTPFAKINSKWIKDLNVRQKTIRILAEKIGSNLFDLGYSNLLLHVSGGKRNKSKNELLETHQHKNFCTVKETINTSNGQPTEWEKMSENDI